MTKLFSGVNKDASLLRDAIFGANDGVVTTFAVIAGSLGGGLSPKIVVILGFANLLADGFSMATGIYLGARSEVDLEKKMKNLHWRQDYPFLQGLTTFLAFGISGFIPLIPFVFGFENKITYSAVLMAVFLLLVGVARGKFTGKNIVRSAVEMLLIGGAAAAIAYGVGLGVDRYLV